MRKLKSISIEKGNSSIVHISSEFALKSKKNFAHFLAETGPGDNSHDQYKMTFHGTPTRRFFLSTLKPKKKDLQEQIISTHYQSGPFIDGISSLPVYEFSTRTGLKKIFFFTYGHISPKNKFFFKYEKKNLIGKIDVKDNTLVIYTMTRKMLNLGYSDRYGRPHSNGYLQSNNSKIFKQINTFIKIELSKSKKNFLTRYLRIKVKNGLYNVYEIRYMKANRHNIKGPYYKSIGCCVELHKK